MVRLILVSVDNVNKGQRLLNSTDKAHFRTIEVSSLNYKLTVNGKETPIHEIKDDDAIEFPSPYGVRRYYLHSLVHITSMIETDYRRALFTESKDYRVLRGKLRNATKLSEILSPMKRSNYRDTVKHTLNKEYKRLEMLSASAKSSEQRLRLWNSYNSLDVETLLAISEDIKNTLRNEIIEERERWAQ